MTRVEVIESASPARRALLVWLPTFGGVGAWIVHLMFLASSVQWVENRHGRRWLLHAATAVCVIVTLACLALARRLYLAAGDAGEAGAADAEQLAFLSRLGLLIGGISLLLILVEGSFVLALPGRG
jgi:hypothetical protein